MAEENEGGIVKKCKKKKCPEGGGSAWEVAYGDFMTSMMAFFLVMWLIAATNIKQRKTLSTYFTSPGATSLTEGSSQMPSKGVFDVGSRSLTISTKLPEMPLPTTENNRIHGKGIIPKVLKNSGGGPTNKKETMKLYTAMQKIEKSLSSNKDLLKYKNQIKIDLTEDGLRIVIFDKNKKPMFAEGSAILEPYAKEILDIIGEKVKNMPNKITIEGHTDSTPFLGEKSNWDLSTMRANSARKELESAGIGNHRFNSVVGYADTRPMPGTDPENIINRRIVITIKRL